MAEKEEPEWTGIRVILGTVIGVSFVFNVIVVINHLPAIENWGTLAIALYAADAEMALVVGAIYAFVFELGKPRNRPEPRASESKPPEITIRVYVNDEEASVTKVEEEGSVT